MPFSFTPQQLSLLLPHLIWAAFIIVTTIVVIYSVILLYHWKKYSIHSTLLASITIITYMIGTGILLLILSAAAFTATT